MMNINPYNDPDDESSNDRVKYFVEDYCKKYPDDRGNQIIYAEDVVRPCNHKWANQAEHIKWRSSYLGDSHDVGLYYERRVRNVGQVVPAINPVKNATRFYTCL
jgi:hypothetical protein